MNILGENSLYTKTISFIKEKVLSDTLSKNIAMVTGGTAMGQVLNALFSPIITRIYTPEEYGILSVFTSFLLIFSFSSLRYEFAIPIARSKEDALNLFVLSFSILSLFSFTIGVLVYAFDGKFLTLFGAESLAPYRIFIPLGIFFHGLFQILRQWMFRMKNFKLVSRTKVTQSLTGNLTKVGLGLLNFGGVGLVLGRILTESAGILSFIKEFRLVKFAENTVSKSNLKDIALKFKDFPLFQTPSNVALHLRNQLPVFFLAPLYGAEIVGLYGLANTIIKIPMNLIGQSVMDVFFVEIASIGKNNPNEIKKLSNDLLKKLILIGSIPLLILVITGPYLFTFVFGVEWYEAGIYVRILSIYIFANLIFSPISKVFEVFRKQNIKFSIDLFSLIIMAIVFMSAYLFNLEARMTILLYSLTMSGVYTVTYFIAQRIINNEIKE